MGIWIRDLENWKIICFIYLWITWIIIFRLLGNNRIRSIICISRITLFPFVLWYISFGYTSSNLWSIKLTCNNKLCQANLKPIIIQLVRLTISLCKWLSRNGFLVSLELMDHWSIVRNKLGQTYNIQILTIYKYFVIIIF